MSELHCDVSIFQPPIEEDNADEDHSFFENLARGLLQVGIEDSVNAVSQTINHLDLGFEFPQIEIIDKPDEGSIGGTCGELLGLAGKIVGVGAALGVAGVAAPLSLGVLTGVGYSMFSLEQEGDNFWENKLKNAAINAVTFGVMSKAAQVFETIPLAKVTAQSPVANVFARRVAVGVSSGAVAGATEAESEALLHHGRTATWSELAYSTARLAAFGAVAGTSEFVLKDMKGPRLKYPPMGS